MAKFKRLVSIVLTIAMLCTTLLSTGMIARASMLPLEEVKAYLVLSGYTKESLSAISVDSILGMLKDSEGNKVEIDSDATTIWKYTKDSTDGLETYDKYTIGANEIINLYPGDGIETFQFEMIIGNNGQLNQENKRYIIKVYLTEIFEDDIQPIICIQDENGVRTEAVANNCNFWLYHYISGDVELNFDLSFGYANNLCDYGSVWLSFKSELANDPRVRIEFHPVDVYLGGQIQVPDYNTFITDKLLNVDMSKPDSGMQIQGKINTDYTYRMVTYVDEVEYSSKYVCVRYWTWYPCHTGKLFADSSTKESITSNVQTNFNSRTKVSEITLELTPEYLDDSQYYFDYDFIMERGYWGITGVENYDTYVKKIVVGHYNSEEEAEAAGATDVTSEILNEGYLANYGGDGIDFTVFKHLRLSQSFPLAYDTLADKINVKVVKNSNQWRNFIDKPIVGEADPWLRVVGASGNDGTIYNVDNNNAYVVENGKSINMDTYYGYGYQTIFINDANIDLGNLKPEFWYANTDRVYAVSEDTGLKVEAGHSRDFSDENQQYAGIIWDNNKENEKNYWVTFKRLNNNGPELFVYGPKEREVILDEYFEFKHDILIANIGNEPLMDISVELVDAENVKLDQYWTVGGNDNDMLAAFTTTSTNTQYGELASIAKIRLLPDGDGEVKGKLIIRAKDQDPVTITLNGTAQNPEIITEELDDAIKYVPYQYIIATNNMHDWVETKFSVSEGDLPAGITLNSETGEIYGVPTVPDGDTETTYTFTVEAKYLVEGQEGYFDASYKEFKLVVKPNTDENVYKASDKNTESSDLNDGYSIKQHIGTQISDYTFELEVVEDSVFISYGQYKEFVKLWLNGILLEEGVDYDSEEGSTKITIKSQTLENSTNSDAANTIAMEFRKDGNGDGKGDDGAKMNRTSQNFNVKKETSIDKVIAKIKVLPEVSNIKLSDKSVVQSARSVYNALSSSEQANVTNRQKLFDLEAQIAKLEEEATNKAAADKVIAKINDIPANITSNAKDEIHNARTAYNALTSAQKKLVTNLDRLEKAEQALSKYEADKAVAQKVVDFITNLPSTLKLEDKDKVNNARTAYNTLTADQKGYVTNYDMLQAAEEEIGKLEAEAREQAKINAAITAIAAIPETVTLNDKATVEEARKAYDALTSVQKDKVINYKDLTDAESAISALEAQENANKADKAAAEEVINLIDTIPEEVSLTDKAKVESIREAYDKLIDNQKKLVTNYGILINAEATIKAFEYYETAAKKDQAAANEIINLINVIPTDVTLDDKATVEAARKAYNTLTDNQKKIVTNYNTLINAEIKIAELENDNYKEVQSITFVGILLDKDGKALADKIVEIHSVVQTGRTDENGSFQFNSVEFDKHTMFVKDENGDITAQREFNIMLGSPLALNGNEIIAENGSVFTLKMQLNGGELTFLSIENGNKAPVVDTNRNEGIDIGESDKTNTIPDTDVGNNQGNVSRPQTGDNSNLALWYTLLFASLGGLIVTTYSNMRRKYADKYQR